MPLLKNDNYTIDDIYALPEGQRAELIDGQIYDMAPPSPMHQKLVMELSATLRNYIKSIEIVSPSSQRMDYLTKLFKYRTAGVREYWIVNPLKQTVQVYSFEGTEDSTQYSFDDEITVTIYGDLKICVADLLK